MKIRKARSPEQKKAALDALKKSNEARKSVILKRVEALKSAREAARKRFAEREASRQKEMSPVPAKKNVKAKNVKVAPAPEKPKTKKPE